ncbi:hypothetical protein BJV77DRAFT_1035799 [Russula vinacea]|nr:hypothetical protein BJV77DRAFT_1035799 [Russula vinacea]
MSLSAISPTALCLSLEICMWVGGEPCARNVLQCSEYLRELCRQLSFLRLSLCLTARHQPTNHEGQILRQIPIRSPSPPTAKKLKIAHGAARQMIPRHPNATPSPQQGGCALTPPYKSRMIAAVQ